LPEPRVVPEPCEPPIDVRLQPAVLLCVAAGGALGALARYGTTRVIHVPTDGFPRATFAINLTGAFVLGWFLTVLHRRQLQPRLLRPLFAIGFLGAFTTFSTMAVETVTLVKDHHAVLGVSYLIASMAAGLSTATLGVIAGRMTAGSPARRSV
jgi:fluoride exporter